jgi:hypothetical protein
MTTHVLDLQLQLLLSSLGGALESEMLKEVGSAVGLIGLSPGTGIDPDTDGRCLREG